MTEPHPEEQLGSAAEVLPDRHLDLSEFDLTVTGLAAPRAITLAPAPRTDRFDYNPQR